MQSAKQGDLASKVTPEVERNLQQITHPVCPSKNRAARRKGDCAWSGGGKLHPPTHTMIVLLQQETGRGGEENLIEVRLERKTPGHYPPPALVEVGGIKNPEIYQR